MIVGVYCTVLLGPCRWPTQLDLEHTFMEDVLPDQTVNSIELDVITATKTISSVCSEIWKEALNTAPAMCKIILV